MHAFAIDYRRDGHQSGRPFHRGYFLTSVQRPLLLCRLLGHKPVVDGTAGFNGRPGHRWLCCDRCGTRAAPQGSLDPARWNIGDRYDGPRGVGARALPSTIEVTPAGGAGARPTLQAPGAWSTDPGGSIGSEVLLGRAPGGWGFSLKVGCPGSDHTLTAGISLSPLGALYVHCDGFGAWLQRRLNATGYDDRVIGLSVYDGRAYWQLWAKSNEHSVTDPWWQQGALTLDPRDRVFGHLRYSYEDIGEPITTTVRLPHGDDHDVVLKLQRCDYGRARRRRFHSWTVDWDCRAGIGTKAPSRGRIMGSGVTVSARSVTAGSWPVEAALGIATMITAERTKYGYRAAEATGRPGG